RECLELDLAITAVRDRTSRSTSLVCTARDLVAQRDLVDETSHARRVDAIGTLAGGVAHDFNNLLMVIGAYAELALHAMSAEDPLRGHLQQILAASRRASSWWSAILMCRVCIGSECTRSSRKHVALFRGFCENTVCSH